MYVCMILWEEKAKNSTIPQINIDPAMSWRKTAFLQQVVILRAKLLISLGDGNSHLPKYLQK
jgi:hypothetical protein